ncbi:oligosaccharide flippase family protein [Rubrobacter marinus]|uniref:Oligosaccharide flippase family protein n=1 Tax=Rubrobacter marinus TaxID=2653852 RepID=A0A6G8PUJ2_9ACTN|nr:oligosaccharide flippase family protein [Rubrobacter marinus]QIN77691.1 oligosaccharide flippase family protein [Rubrobacter marinus]
MWAVRAAMKPAGFSLLKQRLLSGGIWAFTGRLLTSLGQLAINALLARLLAPQDLGAYFLAFSVVTLGAIAGSLGLNQAAVRFVAESMGLDQPGRARRAVTTAVAVGGTGALGVGLLYLPLGYYLSANFFRAPALAAVTGLVAGWMAIMALQSLLAEVFRGFHDIRLATLFGGLLTAIAFTGSLGLLWWIEGRTTLAVVLILAIGSGATSALIAGWVLRRKVAALPRERAEGGVGLGQMLRVAGPLLVTNLTLFTLTQADLWILGAFRSQEEVAVYGAAARLVVLVAVPIFVVNAVLPPMIAEMHARAGSANSSTPFAPQRRWRRSPPYWRFRPSCWRGDLSSGWSTAITTVKGRRCWRC